jgi:hypothetical protein
MKHKTAAKALTICIFIFFIALFAAFFSGWIEAPEDTAKPRQTCHNCSTHPDSTNDSMPVYRKDLPKAG